MARRERRRREEPRDETDTSSLLAEAAEDLASAELGIEFVYRTLDRLRQRSGASDLVAVLEEPALGRQVFRSPRSPIDSVWARDVVRSGSPGAHAFGAAIDEETAAPLLQLCAVALRLDNARHDARHDHLTGLLNRRSFDEVFHAACAQAARYRWTFALVLMDLDRFKDVNDRFGHAAGDAALRAVADELRRTLRAGDVAARLGGDEFALVLPNVLLADLLGLVGRVESAVAEVVPGTNVSLTAGYAFAPDDGDTPSVLYGRADASLYEGKLTRT